MFDTALSWRAALRSEFQALYPGVSFFLRIAPTSHLFLLCSDLPRRVAHRTYWEAFLRKRSVPYQVENGILYLDLPEAVYRQLFAYQWDINQTGPWHFDHYPLQATALMLLRNAASEDLAPSALLREGLRAFALGEQAVFTWALQMRSSYAAHLRMRNPGPYLACGRLLAAFLQAQGIPLPDTTQRRDTPCRSNGTDNPASRSSATTASQS